MQTLLPVSHANSIDILEHPIYSKAHQIKATRLSRILAKWGNRCKHWQTKQGHELRVGDTFRDAGGKVFTVKSFSPSGKTVTLTFLHRQSILCEGEIREETALVRKLKDCSVLDARSVQILAEQVRLQRKVVGTRISYQRLLISEGDHYLETLYKAGMTRPEIQGKNTFHYRINFIGYSTGNAENTDGWGRGRNKTECEMATKAVKEFYSAKTDVWYQWKAFELGFDTVRDIQIAANFLPTGLLPFERIIENILTPKGNHRPIQHDIDYCIPVLERLIAIGAQPIAPPDWSSTEEN